jgi:uncharacterized protein YyaL (SSP411 family)
MGNPVAWQMWGPEALELAKTHGRLIFISIGYAACHCAYDTPVSLHIMKKPAADR